MIARDGRDRQPTTTAITVTVGATMTVTAATVTLSATEVGSVVITTGSARQSDDEVAKSTTDVTAWKGRTTRGTNIRTSGPARTEAVMTSTTQAINQVRNEFVGMTTQASDQVRTEVAAMTTQASD